MQRRRGWIAGRADGGSDPCASPDRGTSAGARTRTRTDACAGSYTRARTRADSGAGTASTAGTHIQWNLFGHWNGHPDESRWLDGLFEFPSRAHRQRRCRHGHAEHTPWRRGARVHSSVRDGVGLRSGRIHCD